MITEKSLARKVLVLLGTLSHTGAFNARKEALLKTGYEIIENDDSYGSRC